MCSSSSQGMGHLLWGDGKWRVKADLVKHRENHWLFQYVWGLMPLGYFVHSKSWLLLCKYPLPGYAL